MQLMEIRTRGYGPFGEPQIVPIRAITIIVGRTLSGKTQLVESLQTLVDAVGDRWGQEGSTTVAKMQLANQQGEFQIGASWTREGKALSLDMRMRPKAKDADAKILEWTMGDADEELRYRSIDEPTIYEVQGTGMETSTREVEWQGAIPQEIEAENTWAKERVEEIRRWGANIRRVSSSRTPSTDPLAGSTATSRAPPRHQRRRPHRRHTTTRDDTGPRRRRPRQRASMPATPASMWECRP